MRIVLHPFVVHFPIALLLLNFALTVLYLRRGDPFLERAAYGALVIGWWGAFAAVVTGVIELAQDHGLAVAWDKLWQGRWGVVFGSPSMPQEVRFGRRERRVTPRLSSSSSTPLWVRKSR